MLASASGELNTQASPKRRCRPCVSLKTPPLPFTLPLRLCLLTSETSSPKKSCAGSGPFRSSASDRSGRPSCRDCLRKRRCIERRRRRVDVGRKHTFRHGGPRSGASASSASSAASSLPSQPPPYRGPARRRKRPRSSIRNSENLRKRILRASGSRSARQLDTDYNHRTANANTDECTRACTNAGSAALAHIRRGLTHGTQASDKSRCRRLSGPGNRETIGTSLEMSPPGGLDFNRNGDRIAVIFDEEHDRQAQGPRSAQRFPELAFARRASPSETSVSSSLLKRASRSGIA